MTTLWDSLGLQAPPDATLAPAGSALRDWLALRATAPMRQAAAKANRRRPRPDQEGLADVPLFERLLF